VFFHEVGAPSQSLAQGELAAHLGLGSGMLLIHRDARLGLRGIRS
jgi:hypothetical protein